MINTFYIMGRMSTGGGSSVYDDEDSYSRLRLHICDTSDDLPESPTQRDIAITPSDGNVWTADAGVWHNQKSATWPVGSVIILVPASSPADLLGFGTWVEVDQAVLPAHVWRRTA